MTKDYVDISLAFEPNPVTGDLTVLTNERAINNALKNIMLVAVSEVPFNRDFGSVVRDYLFDNVDVASAGLIYNEVRRAIKYNEPRVKIKHMKVDPLYDQNNFMVTLRYQIVGFNEVFEVVTLLEPTM